MGSSIRDGCFRRNVKDWRSGIGYSNSPHAGNDIRSKAVIVMLLA